MLGTYSVILTCRNSESIIKDALLSLKNQTVQPAFVIVINDGSTDRTAEILAEIKKGWPAVHVITHPDYGYDVTRIVRNWNEALDYEAKNDTLPQTDFHMIATDDTIYPPHYAESLLSYMAERPKLAIVSGDYAGQNAKTPHGAGRFVRNACFKELTKNGRYPEKLGYESWIVAKAILAGHECKVIPYLTFKHIRPLGSDHKFREFGSSMRALGYHPAYAIGRCLLSLATGKPTGRLGACYMLYYYLTFKPKPGTYESEYDDETRQGIKKMQWQNITTRIKLA